MRCRVDPILRFTDGSKIVDLIEGGWKLSDPYWNPQIAQYKGGGVYINSALADGQRLVHKVYDNVIETFPLSVKGFNPNKAIGTIRELLQLGRQASDFWTKSFEFDNVWAEVKPPDLDAKVGYAKVIKMSIPELTNPYGQPYFSTLNEAVMEGITLTIEREPLWRGVAPGSLIGPLYNLIRNPDFELWSSAKSDGQPDNWTDIETTHITGTNNQESTAPHSGQYCLRVRVSGSTLTGKAKGIYQVISGIKDQTSYTVIAWVRSDGVSNGVGRILVTYSSQLELYRSASRHGWTLYTGLITTGIGDVVAVTCEILTTAANTDGTVYFDSLMLIEGDWRTHAIDLVLPYISSSHIVNHWDSPETSLVESGDINWVDVWDIPGDDDAYVRLEIVNNTTPAVSNNPTEVISVMRVGMRRAGNIFNFKGWQDPPGQTDTTASGDSRLNSGTLSTTSWTRVHTFTISSTDLTEDNQGRYRLFVRVYDTRTTGILTLQIRANYWVGAGISNIKTLEIITCPAINKWCIVDLTPVSSINWDTKFRSDIPGSFGFNIEMKRSANTDTARIDYAFLMPTDGGLLVAEIEPAVIQNDALVIDQTGVSNSVFGLRKGGNWKLQFVTEVLQGSELEQAIEYNDALFIRGVLQTYKYKNNVLSISPLGAPSGSGSELAVYNGKLIWVDGNDIRESNGESASTSVASLTVPAGLDVVVPLGISSLGGNLYIAGYARNNAATIFRASMWVWNGIAATVNTTIERADLESFQDIATYKNKLYLHAVTTTPNLSRIYVYDPNNGSFQVSLDDSGAGVETSFQGKAFTIFNDNLWTLGGGSPSTTRLWYFDGLTWTSLNPTLPGFSNANIVYRTIAQINGVLFVGGNYTIAGISNPFVIKSTDGVNWTVDLYLTLGIDLRVVDLTAFQGQLFAVVFETNLTNPGRVYAKSVAGYDYNVSTYQLSPFKSPSRERANQKRHRYFFNWDRKDNVNNVDDQALVGIGFVPRYLSLRGND